MNSFSTLEEAYETLGAAAIQFGKDRSWDEITGEYELLIGMVSSRWCLVHEGICDKKGNLPPKEIQHASMDAAEYLRDELLRSTGNRIWGLTFTLYATGKFKLNYDYDKPEGYEETAETINPQDALASLQKMGRKVEIEDGTGH